MLIARDSGVVPYEAHNLETPVQIRLPQHTLLWHFCFAIRSKTLRSEATKGCVAQRLEQGLHKAKVGGSIPPAATKFGLVA